MPVKSKGRKAKFFKIALYLCIIFLGLSAIHNAFSIYRVSGSSMNPALSNGDYVIIIHRKYLLFRHKVENFVKDIIGKNSLSKPYRFSKNDMLLIQIPNNIDGKIYGYSRLVKRNFALPGDSLLISNLDRENIHVSHCTDCNSKRLVDKDHSKVVVVPAKWMRVELDSVNVDYWERIIRYEKPDFKVSNFLQSQDQKNNVGSYQFNQDYYFLLGDNSENSTDSRHWGMLPESLVTGKVLRAFRF